MQKILQIMKICPLFSGIEEKQLEALLACLGARRKKCVRGEVVLAEGDPADCLGVVISGSVHVVRDDYYGNRSIMTRLAPGEIFAEAFACAEIPEIPVSVIALDTTEVMFIDAGRIIRTCGNACGFHNQLIYNMMKILAIKNLMCNQKIEITSKRNTREKLMTYLLLQAKRARSSSFTVPFDRQELADYLEVDRSGLSAEISKLRREGVLECERNYFRLLKDGL